MGVLGVFVEKRSGLCKYGGVLYVSGPSYINQWANCIAILTSSICSHLAYGLEE